MWYMQHYLAHAFESRKTKVIPFLLLLAHEILIFIVCDYELVFMTDRLPQLLLKQSYLPILGLH